jgi:O-methyltransferase
MTQTALGKRSVFEGLALGVEYAYASAVPGHIGEFGTGAGESAAALANAMCEAERLYGSSERLLYLFDSFEGFPQTNNPIDAASPHVLSNAWGPGVARSMTAEALSGICSAFLGPERVKVTAGWYSETLPTFPSDIRFALVNVDCDLYESTASVLEYLLGKQTYSDGCAVFFDDWYCNQGSPEFGERKAWADYTSRYETRFTDWGPYSAVGHKFILHRSGL